MNRELERRFQIRILHIDDEIDFLKTTKQILEMNELFHVKSVKSVKQAEEMLENEEFDVIVSDYKMQEKDGMEFLKEFRESGDTTPFILFTGQGKEEVTIKALNLRADHYVNKSGNPETVYGLLSHYIQEIARKQQIEQSLMEHEDRLKKISKQMPGMLYQFKRDVDGSYSVPFSTEGIREIFGCFPEDVNSDFSPIANVIFPKDYEKVLESIEVSAKHLSSWECEFRVQIPGFPVKWMLARSIPEKQTDGSIIWSGYNVDITERKKAEHSLRQKNEILKTVTQNTRAGLSVISKDFDVLYANKVVTDARGDVLGKKCYSVLDNRKTICPNCGVKEIFETGKNQVTRNIVIPDSKGNDIHLELTATAIRNAKGEITSATEIALNLTESKTAQKKLSAEINLKTVLLDNFPCIAMILRKGTREIIASNKRAKEVGAVPGKTCYSTCAKRNDTCTFCLAPKLWETNEPQTLEIEYNGKWYKGFWAPYNEELYVHYIFDITDSKRNALKLKENFTVLNNLLNNSQFGICHYDLDGKITLLNQKASEYMKGYPNDFIGKDVKEVFGENLGNLILDRIKKVIESKTNKIYEDKVNLPSGEKWFNSVYHPIIDSKEKIIGCQIISNEATEQKKAEEKLVESELIFRSLFMNMQEGVAIHELTYDSKGNPNNYRIVDVNRKFETILSLKKEDVKGKYSTEAYGVEDPPFFEIYRQVAETGKPTYFEEYFPPMDKHFKVTVFSIKKGSFVTVFEDITKHKKAENDVQEALDELSKHQIMIEGLLSSSRAVLENREFKDSALIIFNKVKDLIGATTGYVALLTNDGKQNEVLFTNSDNLEHIVASKPPMPIRKLRELAYKTGTAIYENQFISGDFVKLLPKDHVKLENVLFGPLVLDGKATGLIGLANKPGGFTDEDVEIIEAFSKIAVIALRNSRILEALEDGKNDALRMNEKLNVVGKISRHDARNKMAVIANNVYLAKLKLSKDNQILENLESVEKAVEQIERIFNFSSVYEKLGVEQLSTVDVGKCVDEAGVVLGSDSIELVNGCIGLSVVADSLLTQLFYNLMHNSMIHGETVTQIRIHHKKTNDSLKIIYEDNGIGIPDNEKDLIFKEGYGKGTGYGLFLIKRICEAYGWTINETGTLGKGAKFTITIPKNQKK